MGTREEELFIKNTYQAMCHGKNSKFLNQKEYYALRTLLKKEKIDYQVFTFCKTDSSYFLSLDKILLYTKTPPEVCCMEIKSKQPLTHREILGSLFSLSIDMHNFGDIFLFQNRCYFLVLKELSNYVLSNLYQIGNHFVTIEEVDIKNLAFYQKEFETFSIITSSLRIDTILSRLAKVSRKNAVALLKEKKVLLNYSEILSASTLLKEEDILSIRRVGKFYFSSIKGNTKSGNFIIEMKKYH